MKTTNRLEGKYEVVDNGYLTPCWEWQRSCNEQGYPRLAPGYAHRYSYEHFIGPIPEGLTIDHLCRVRCCVMPLHLEPVTLKVNHERRPKPAACPKGHEFTEANTYLQGSVKTCRACHADRERNRRAR